MKKIVSVILLIAMALSLFACSTPETLSLKKEEIKDVVVVEMSVKGYGKMTFELYHDVAPITVENFVSLVNEGFYNGTVFHRVIKNFMIQGGDSDGDGIGGSDKTIKGEFSANGFNNTLKHERGVISMARTNDPNSASSQFFIMHAANTALDGSYAAFGKMTEGFEVLDKIAEVETVYNATGTERSVPAREIVLSYVIVKGTFDRDGADAADSNTASLEELCEKTVNIEIAVKDYGTISLELYPDLAPITVENFISLANEGFYDGLTFHRIIEGFMIQGGDPKGDGTGGSEKKIKGEFINNGVYNPLSHERGVISMARGGYSMDSASSQFFIVHRDSVSLDGDYAAFGRVTSGMDIVDSIATVNTNASDAPLVPVIIDYVKVVDDAEEETTDTTAPTDTNDATETTEPATDAEIGDIVTTDTESSADETTKEPEDTKLVPEIM